MSEQKRKISGTNPSLEAVERSAVISAVQAVTPSLKMPKVNPQDAKAVQERIEQFFQFCIEQNTVPTWELMSLYLGVTRKTAWMWCNGRGCSHDTAETILRAKEALAGIDTLLVMQGKINPVSYIFRSKNYYEMSDAITINTPLEEQPRNIEELKRRYTIDDVVLVDEPGTQNRR